MIFRQFEEPQSNTYTYLVGCETTRECALIDPVASEVSTYLEAIADLGLILMYSMDTHVHADHVTAASRLRDATGCSSVLHESAGVECADIPVTDGDRILVGQYEVEVLHTPGHTDACISLRVGDRIFTGDALLIDGCGRTDFQAGDPARLYDSIHSKIFSLPEETLVYPGHDYHGRRVSSVGEQKVRNQRLGGNRSKAEFVALMNNLDLPYPKQIDAALPANLACGNA